MTPPERLENDARNPCIGCGPENPLGLRLAFEREGETVATTLEAKPAYQGWPGRLHSGILYLALLETANWTVYGARGRVGLPVRTGPPTFQRWVAVGERLRLLGRAEPGAPELLRVAVSAADGAGRPVAALTREYEFPPRAEFLARMGYATVPPELDGLLGP